MFESVRKLLVKLTPSRIANSLLYTYSNAATIQNLYCCLHKRKDLKYSRLSFSQEGEDLLIDRLLDGVKNGFYVDIGAHHPFRFSNTCLFYLRGWRGINIEPNPDLIKELEQERPDDINLCLGVSQRNTYMNYYMFNEPALNTFSEARVKILEKQGYKVISQKSVKTKPLSVILDENLSPDTDICFMNIDTEGLDLDVLLSNNWARYSPQFIILEDLSEMKENINQSPVESLLSAQGYSLTASLCNSVIFSKNK